MAMILVDANLLLYAVVRDLPRHPAAREWLQERLSGESRVGLPWESLLAFSRIATNPRVFGRPLASEVAWRQVCGWLECPVVWVPLPTEQHARTLGGSVEGFERHGQPGP